MVDGDQIHPRAYQNIIAESDSPTIHEDTVKVDEHPSAHPDIFSEVGVKRGQKAEDFVNPGSNQP